MRPHFLFPSCPIRHPQVDPEFQDQADAARESGYSVSVVPESAFETGTSLRGVPAGSTVVYRGWMLSATAYANLHAAVARTGATMLTSTTQYLAAHHLPNWYPLIRDLTPETHTVDASADLAQVMRSLAWPAYFVKDFVKSVKTSSGSIVRDPVDVDRLIAEMRRIRGEIEGGLCFRRVEEFLTDAERRYFVLAGRAFASDGLPVPALVTQVVHQIRLPFYSADVVARADGVLRVVEIGDGQVSDLVGWTAEAFMAMW